MHRFLSLLIFWLLLLPPLAYGQQQEDVLESDCSLKLAVSTTASRETVWRLWSNVEGWKRFDTLLEYAYLNDDAAFEQGATGYVKADGAPRTPFELTLVEPGVRFTETLKLPLYHSLDLLRYFETTPSGETVFVHQVDFRGPFKQLLFFFLKKPFAEELPLVMGRLRDLAEQQEAVALH